MKNLTKVQTKSKAPQKLGAKDFVFSYGKDGKKKFDVEKSIYHTKRHEN